MLRILLLIQGSALIIAVAKAKDLAGVGREMMDISVLLQPVLLLSLVLLFLVNGLLAKLPYRTGVVIIVALELGVTALVSLLLLPVVDGNF